MQSNIEISSFRWEDTDDVVEFLNKVTKVENTEKEVSKEFFTKYHLLPESNPEVDSFLAKTQQNEIIGFMHLIFEKQINRLVVITEIAPVDQKNEIFIKFMDIAQDFAISNKINVIHTQVDKKDSLSINYLKKDWSLVKEYWNLKCNSLKLSTPEISQIPDEYTVEHLDPNNDISNLTHIQNISFKDHWGFCPNTEEEIRARVEMTNNNPEGILLVKNKEEVAGYNWTIFASKNNHATGWISMTGVSPKYRGLGLGKLVVQLGIEYLFRKGANSIELEVDSANTPALTLYKNLGFKKHSETIWFEKTNL